MAHSHSMSEPRSGSDRVVSARLNRERKSPGSDESACGSTKHVLHVQPEGQCSFEARRSGHSPRP